MPQLYVGSSVRMLLDTGGSNRNLDTISLGSGTTGSVVILRKTATTGSITIRNGQDNIRCGSPNKVLATTEDTAMFMWTGSKWCLVGGFQSN